MIKISSRTLYSNVNFTFIERRLFYNRCTRRQLQICGCVSLAVSRDLLTSTVGLQSLVFSDTNLQIRYITIINEQLKSLNITYDTGVSEYLTALQALDQLLKTRVSHYFVMGVFIVRYRNYSAGTARYIATSPKSKENVFNASNLSLLSDCGFSAQIYSLYFLFHL